MKIRTLFKRFKQKVLFESILKSLLFGLIVGSSATFILSLVYHIMVEKTPIVYVTGIFGITFIISFVIFFIIKYPTTKKVAKRIDEVGLQERAATMLELRNEDTEIAKLQREDAVTKIKETNTKKIKIRILKQELITGVICVTLATVMMLLPYNIFSGSISSSAEEREKEQAIRDLIQSLRDEVKESAIEEDLKEALDEIIDDLEEDLEETESELEQAAKVNQAKEKMEELLEKEITKKKIGEALQGYEITQKLGEAISAGDTEKVSSALEELEDELKKDTKEVSELRENILSALKDSGVDSSDTLYSALDTFSDDLSDIDVNGSSFESDLAEAFENAEKGINEALERQANIEQELENLEEKMDELKDEALGKEEEEKPEGEDPEGENPEGEMPEGEKPDGEMPDGEKPDGEMPDGDFPGGEGGEGGDGGGTSSMTEGIYDPYSGDTSYGEVFASYYADYLKALEEGNVPEELQDIIDRYYSSLMK